MTIQKPSSRCVLPARLHVAGMTASVLLLSGAIAPRPAAAQVTAKTTTKTAAKNTAKVLPAVPFRAKTAAPVDANNKTLFLVGYAHLDTQWRWAYPQVIREFIPDTLHNNFALMDKYPDYVFNFSGSRRYEMMKEYYPEDYVKLKKYVKSGQWFPAGSSVDEGDANVPSAESLVRHVLYGNHFFKREFGVASEEFMLPDCFGFPYALPTILTHCGVTGFSTQKLTWGSAIGIPFKVGRWEGPDGTSVIAALDPGSYGGGISEDMSQNTSWLARVQNTGMESGAYTDYHYYGVGDRGGAPDAKSVEWVEKSVKGSGPLKVVSSRADEMFLSITPTQKAKLPVYKGEILLTEHSAGSVTSQAYMKRWNRKNEQLADSAERAAVAAMWMGGPKYPTERLYQAWNLLLGSQMHDILPGTSLPKAYEFSWNDEVLAANQFAAVASDSVSAVTSVMDTQAQGMPLVVYNPLSVAREDIVEATVSVPGDAKAGVQVYGPDDKPVPTQVLERSGSTARILFVAKMPSTAFVTYDVRPAPFTPSQKELSVSNNQMENARFRVTLDANGDVSSIYDKTNQKEALKSPIRFALQYHNPSAFPAWNMDWSDAQKPPRAYVDSPATVRVVENGPVRVALEISREYDGSRYVQTVSLASGTSGNQVVIANQIDWQTRQSALKASFPLTTGNAQATYDLQVGTTMRGNNDPKKYEVPQHQWFDLTKPDNSYGVAVLNESKFGSDKPDDDTMRLTLLYTPGVRGGYEDQANQDFGRHDIRYAVAPHAGDWRSGDIAWMAKRFNRPLLAFSVPKHAGRLGKTFSLVSTNSKQVEIQAIKKAEDSGEIIVRLRELSGKPATDVQIKMAGQIVSAREVSGQEYPLGAASVKNGVLTTTVPGYALKAFAIKLAPAPAKIATLQTQTVALPYDTDAVSPTSDLTDGAFDKEGRTFAAESFPRTLETGPVSFTLGATGKGAKNALTSKGQTIALPAGYNRVYVLAASSDGDVAAKFMVGSTPVTKMVENWGGYVGQWDNRLWIGDVPELTYGWTNPWGGLAPGYVKDGEVAWFLSHQHSPKNGDEFYQYSYLFKYAFDIPAGAKTITLPNDARVKVFAVTAQKADSAPTASVTPLHDTLASHGAAPQAPRILPPVGQTNDVVTVALEHPLYWQAGGLHYTLDGSTPTAASPVYSAPIEINRAVTVKAAEMDEAGNFGPVVASSVMVNDTTAPQLTSAEYMPGQAQVTVKFSEALDKTSAETASNYRLSSGTKVKAAMLSGKGDKADRTVVLTLDAALPAGPSPKLMIGGIKDTSPNANAERDASAAMSAYTPVYTSTSADNAPTKRVRVENLPSGGSDPWTINLYVKMDKEPEDRTVIAGFGRVRDGQNGAGRYITKFGDGIHFWSANQDVVTNVPFDLGKWQMVTATYDGNMVRVYKNGKPIGEKAVTLSEDRASVVNIKPKDGWENQRVLDGDVEKMTVWKQALAPSAVALLWEQSKTP